MIKYNYESTQNPNLRVK